MTRMEHPALAALSRPVVDAHHHLWDLGAGRYPWLQQDYDARAFFLGEYRDICRDFLPADYRRVSERCQVVATVHVEAERDRSEQVAETTWLHAQHKRHGLPDAIVAHAKRDHPNEACGVVAGATGSDHPARMVEMVNAAASPTFYEFDSTELLHLYRDLLAGHGVGPTLAHWDVDDGTEADRKSVV